MRRALITGVNGFSGRHLAERLRRERAHATGLGTATTAACDVDRYLRCDLTDQAAVARAVAACEPDEVYHLASAKPHESPATLRDVIVVGFQNLYEALVAESRRSGKRVRLLTVGSAAELGKAGVAKLPVDEQAPCLPLSDYGRAKFAVTRFVQSLPPRQGVEVIVARTFNLVGPGLSGELSLGRFARQIAAVRRGATDRIRCGNLSHRRDFVDVRDAVQAYVALVRRGRAGQVYNVATGRSYMLGDVLEQMQALAGCTAPIESDAGAPRAADVVDIYGDVAKIAAECGWRAVTPLEVSLRGLLSSSFEAAATEARRTYVRSA